MMEKFEIYSRGTNYHVVYNSHTLEIVYATTIKENALDLANRMNMKFNKTMQSIEEKVKGER